MTLSLPLHISGHIAQGWDAYRTRPELCPRGVLRGGTDASTVLCLWPNSQRQRSRLISTLPPPTPGGTEQAQSPQRRSCPLPRPLSWALGSSGGFADIFFASGPRELIGFSDCTCLGYHNTGRVWEKRDKDRGLERWVMCSCLVLSPLPTMCLSRCEGVFEGGGPHWGATVVTTSSCWGRGSPERRPEESTSVTKSRSELCGFYLVPGVWGQSPMGDPRHAGQASSRRRTAGGVLAAFSVVLAPETVTLGPATWILCSSFLPAGQS